VFGKIGFGKLEFGLTGNMVFREHGFPEEGFGKLAFGERIYWGAEQGCSGNWFQECGQWSGTMTELQEFFNFMNSLFIYEIDPRDRW